MSGKSNKKSKTEHENEPNSIGWKEQKHMNPYRSQSLHPIAPGSYMTILDISWKWEYWNWGTIIL